MTSFSPTRLRSRSFLNNPPGYNPDVPGHSILLNSTDRLDSDRPSDQGGQRAPSPHRSISTTSSHASNTNSSQSHGYGYAHSEADFTGSKASSGSVSFAPLPVIPPELKRRSSITLGVAARKNLLSSPEDEIYPDPRRAGAGAGAGSGSGAGAAGGAGGKSKGNGAVKAVYMNDQDWEEYKRQHDVKNGNDVVDIGELVTNQAKNLWRRVKTGTSPSPTTSTSSQLPPTPGSTNAKIASSPSSSTGGGILNALTSPRMSMRRRSDPGQPPDGGPGPKEAATATATGGRVPDLPDVEEESLSRYQSAEMKLGSGTGHHEHHHHAVSLPTEKHLGDINEDEKKPRYVAIDYDTKEEVEVQPPPPSSSTSMSSNKPQARRQHSLSSPPPRVQDVLPSEDEIKEGHERELEGTLHEHPEEEEEELDEQNDKESGYQGGVGTLGLENVEIKSGPGYDHLQDSQDSQPPSQQSQPSHVAQHQPHPQPQAQLQQPGQSGKHSRGHDTDVLGFDRSRFGGS